MNRTEVMRLANLAGFGFNLLDDEYCDSVGLPRGSISHSNGDSIEQLEVFVAMIEAKTLNARPQDTRVFDAHIAGLDGWADWAQPKHNGYLLKCCDCGLVHEMEFAVAKYRRDECDECEIVEDKNLRVIFRARREEDIPSARKIETNPYLKDVQKWDVVG